MAVTMDQIKELRERTLVSFSDCKNALIETDGDVELAIEALRKKWIAKAAKRADNETKEWKIKIDVAGNKAYIVSVGCETDFVSRNDVFGEMLDKFLEALKSTGDETTALTKCEEIKSDYVLKIGENLKILALNIVSGDAIESYVHSNGKLAAVVTAKAGTDAEKLKQVAMHVVATNPEVMSPADMPADVVAKEKEIQLEQMKQDPKNANKPADILEKIIEWKIKKFTEENALLTQQFVVNPDVTVGQLMGENLVSFKRFGIGE